MSTKSKFVNGYQVYYDEYEHRWVKAIGPAAREWELRIGSDFTTGCEFTTTLVDVGAGTSAATQAVTVGDRLLITNAGNENDGLQLQLVGTPYQIASGKPFYFGCKASISNATETDFFVGLSELDTTLVAAHAVTISNGVYFYKDDGATVITANAEIAGVVSSATVSTACDTSKHIYEILFDGTSMSFYFDAGLVATITSGWPTVVVTPSIALMNGSAHSRTASVEWMRCIQLP
jgi:hypothetical protein